MANGDLRTASNQLMNSRPDRLPRQLRLSPFSIVLSTNRSISDLKLMFAQISVLSNQYRVDLDVLLIDEHSIEASKRAEHGIWIRCVEGQTQKGAGWTVLEAIRQARHPRVVVLDADSNPSPEQILALVNALSEAQPLVITPGHVSQTGLQNGSKRPRQLLEGLVKLLTRPLTDIPDPHPRSFALLTKLVESPDLNPVSGAVALEVIVRHNLHNVASVALQPHQSKATPHSFRETLHSLRHLRHLYIKKFSYASAAAQFAIVGCAGVVVNLGVLTVLVALGVSNALAVGLAIGVSVVQNFLLNRRFTFGYARNGSFWKQFAGYVLASAGGIAVNYAVTIGVQSIWLGLTIQQAALCGIAAGMGLNYLANQFLVFGRHQKPAPSPKSDQIQPTQSSRPKRWCASRHSIKSFFKPKSPKHPHRRQSKVSR